MSDPVQRSHYINISRTCIFAFVSNIYTKNSTFSAIKNIRYTLIYTNFFVASKDNNNKKEVVSFYVVAFITSTIKKYRNCISNLVSREFVFFFSLIVIMFCLIRINNITFAILFVYTIKVYRNIIKQNIYYL